MAETEPATKPVAEDAKQAAREVGKGRPGTSARRFLWPIAAACLVLFAADAYIVTSKGYTIFDRAVELFVQGFPWGPLVYVFDAINWLGGLKQLIFGFVVAVAFFVWDRRAGWLLFVGAGASLIDNVLKVAFQRQRPSATLVHIVYPDTTGYSFPSGHAVFFTWLAILVAAALAPRLHPRIRPLLWTVAGFVILLTCLSRIYDGVHWPTDVIGGLLIGLGWAAFVLWLPERWLPTPSRTWWQIVGRRRRKVT
ncbi:MAG: hypothetical protein NVS9B1_00630 [Candidatus Dormibacteraceae bacterium]